MVPRALLPPQSRARISLPHFGRARRAPLYAYTHTRMRYVDMSAWKFSRVQGKERERESRCTYKTHVHGRANSAAGETRDAGVGKAICHAVLRCNEMAVRLCRDIYFYVSVRDRFMSFLNISIYILLGVHLRFMLLFKKLKFYC